jgi:EF-hand domain pair
LFKKLDVNSDGNVSKNEMIEGFKHVGIDCEKEIDDIMENLDMDQSGSLDFSELKIVLIDWEKEINDENLAKVFSTNSQGIEFDAIKGELIEILPSEWIEFSKKVKFENGIVPFEPFKAYIKANLVY